MSLICSLAPVLQLQSHPQQRVARSLRPVSAASVLLEMAGKTGLLVLRRSQQPRLCAFLPPAFSSLTCRFRATGSDMPTVHHHIQYPCSSSEGWKEGR